MTTQNDNESLALRSVLKEWKTNASLPPRFSEQVWTRIEKAEAVKSMPVTTLFSQWLERVFARPVIATAYLAVLLVLGATAGSLRAQHRESRIDDELAARYVQSLDPYQKVANR